MKRKAKMPPASNSSYPWRFSTYLQPAIPFRRRSSATTETSIATRRDSSASSTDSQSSQSTTPSEPSSPQSLCGDTSLLRCSRCLEHICPVSCIISKGFHGRHGRAYLVSASALGTPNEEALSLSNIVEGRAERRVLVTGPHTVANISCANCHCELGWKYVAAGEEDQQYKVGKYILETTRVVKMVNWEEENQSFGQRGKELQNIEDEDEEIVFNSEDDDECEDLFSGVWSEKLAAKRRRDKLWKTIR
jgi:hypothetical protein